MKVCIDTIEREVDEGFIVRFNSSYGKGRPLMLEKDQ